MRSFSILLWSVSLCLVAGLASCSQEEAQKLTLRPISPSLNDRLDNLSSSQMKKLEEIFKINPIPLQAKQQNFSVLRVSQSCAKKRLLVTLDAHLSDETFVVFKKRFLKAQQQCFRDIVDETLIVSGSDKAYEVNVAVRNFDPSFPIMVVPSYVIVDEESSSLVLPKSDHSKINGPKKAQ